MSGDPAATEGLGLRRWSTGQLVELVEDTEGEPALLYRPAATARDAFPEWYGDGFGYAVTEDGSEIGPRDLWSAPEKWKQTDDAELFADFIGLLAGSTGEHGGPDTFEEFAVRRKRSCRSLGRRYGVLRLCKKHRLPVGHTAPEICRPPLNPEPMREWWEWSKTFRAIKRLADTIRDGGSGSDKDWATVLDREAATIRKWRRQGGNPGRTHLVHLVSRWLELARFRPYLTWEEVGEPEFHVLDPTSSPTPLFAALARQLAHEVTGATDTYVCSACGNAYVRRDRKKPKPGQANYCLGCENGRGEWLHRKRRQRAANRAEE